MSTVKISDIAKAANVSPATVTRVINNSGYVSEEKRAIVLKTITQLGYIPNKVASGLRKRKSNFIGHVLPVSSENPFFARIGSSFDKAAELAGYHVLTTVTNMDTDREKYLIEYMVSLMVEAIVFTTKTASDPEIIKWILSRGIPVVMIERPHRIDNIDVILMDHFDASRIAIEHIVKKGHTNIGFIGKQYTDTKEVEFERFKGFMSTMEDYNIPIRKEWIRFIPDYTVEFGRQALEDIISKGPLPTALVITSDVIACGVLQVLYENRLRVPDDISLVGFDNTLSALSVPPLTSIELQPDQIGQTAVNMILERKNGGRIGAKTVTLSPVLVDRNSVKTL